MWGGHSCPPPGLGIGRRKGFSCYGFLERKNKSTKESTSEPTPKAADKSVRPTRLSESHQADVRGLKSGIHLTNSSSASEQTAAVRSHSADTISTSQFFLPPLNPPWRGWPYDVKWWAGKDEYDVQYLTRTIPPACRWNSPPASSAPAKSAAGWDRLPRSKYQ